MQTAYEASSAAILPKSAQIISNRVNRSYPCGRVGASVADRVSHLIKALSVYGHADILDEAQSVEIWRDIKNVSPILSGDNQIWRYLLRHLTVRKSAMPSMRRCRPLILLIGQGA